MDVWGCKGGCSDLQSIHTERIMELVGHQVDNLILDCSGEKKCTLHSTCNFLYIEISSFVFRVLITFLKKLLKYYLIYNLLVLGVQQSDSVIHPFIYLFFRFFSLIGYYKILSKVACAKQQVLVNYLCYIQQFVCVKPKLIISLSPLPLW